MAGYQRFVAYVYEYRKGKKDGSSGYVRVEAMDRKCRMEVHLRCVGLEPGSRCRVYGFVRREGLMDGILIGSCVTGREQIECVLETETENVGGMGKSLRDLGGMLLISDAGGFWGTEWDDQPIRPENFREWKKEEIGIMKAEAVSEEEEEALEASSERARPEPLPPRPEPPRPEPPRPPRPLPGVPCEIPFDDGQFTDCRKVKPSDCSVLCKQNGCFCNNRFVIYGYQNFGHLLLCRNHRGQYILGIPGGYSQQERFMASMFGFPYFRECRDIHIPGGKGGYWYCFINI